MREAHPQEVNEMSVQDRIKEQIGNDNIVLYMKGTPQFPQCGFSGQSVQILQACGAKFASYDVLSDPEIRQGIKDYASWPTIPQLYINGEFVGGCDIMTDLFQSGELKKMVDAAS
jgi:monothiol glutaredoxin